MNVRQKPAEKVWKEFKEQEKLTDEQLIKFQKYEALLTEWNKNINLTAIHNLSEMVQRHFRDSLALRNCEDLGKIKSITDVGAGAGFPSIPLKIMFPHLGVILLEVNKKKQLFLKELIKVLELEGVEVCGIDWRTFLRTTEGDIDLFLARASLPDDELIRMFKPGCSYKKSQLVYWASMQWEPDERTVPFIKKECEYTIKKRNLKLVFLGL
jgi:16S rRNA (guanine(527)-N(7))-methyltransferase RsmG